jgi:hypothetical protein
VGLAGPQHVPVLGPRQPLEKFGQGPDFSLWKIGEEDLARQQHRGQKEDHQQDVLSHS